MILMSEKMTSQNKLYEIELLPYNKPHTKKEIMSLRLDVKVIFSLQKEHVYHIGFYMVPYIWAHIGSWHTWPAQKETTSCTRFHVQDWHWIGYTI
jgi:hypothetical protein